MFKIWALVVEAGDEMNITLFWRKQDAIDVLPEVLSEYIEEPDAASQAGLLMGNLDKLFAFLEEQEIDCSLDEVEIEGQIDAKQFKKLEKLVVGPKLVAIPGARVTPIQRAQAKAAGCRTFIDGVEVK